MIKEWKEINQKTKRKIQSIIFNFRFIFLKNLKKSFFNKYIYVIEYSKYLHFKRLLCFLLCISTVDSNYFVRSFVRMHGKMKLQFLIMLIIY